jgi:isopropylmalate/homocitrate/citramalate synthase
MVAALVRHYGDPGFDLTALEEMRQLVDRDVIELNDRLPLIGEVFTTTAGIHQAGVGRQDDAPGGLIYLPFAASLFGRKEVELSRIGSLSGSEGIISVLNRELERSGSETRVKETSRVVKLIYDRIQEEYDGQFDAQHDHWVNSRRAFFTSEDIITLAREFGAL